MNRLLAAVALFAFTSISFGASALGLYPEDFFQGVQMTPPALSPDGEKVLWVNRGLNGSSLEVFDFDSGKSTVLWSSNNLGPPINYVAWANQERVVYQVGFGDIIAVDIDGSDWKRLYEAQRLFWTWGILLWGNFTVPEIESTLPNDQDHILISYFDNRGARNLYRLNIHTAEEKLEEKDRWRSTIWLFGTDETVRAALVQKRNKVEFHYADPRSGKWKNLDRELSQERDLNFTITGKSQAGRQDTGLMINSDSKFYYSSSKGRDTWALFEMDLRNPANVRKVHEDERYDLPSSGLGVPPLVFDGDRLVGLRYEGEKLEQVWLDPEFAKLQARIDALSEEAINLIVHWDKDKRRYIVFSYADVQPGKFSYYDVEKDVLLPIGKQTKGLSSDQLNPMMPIRFISRDGLAIEGYFTLPKNGKPPYPTVALVHGGPAVRDSWGYDPEAQLLAYNGMAVLQVNFRGSTGYGYSHRTAMREDFAVGPLTDILAGLDWAVEEGYVDTDRIAIMGFSYGGYAALMAAAMHPGRFKACVAGGAPVDLPELFNWIRKVSPNSYNFWSESLGYINNKEMLNALSPAKLTSQISDPVFLYHGRYDDVVPFTQFEIMKAALERTAKNATFVVMNDEGHGISDRKEVVRVYGRILRFLEQHLKQ